MTQFVPISNDTRSLHRPPLFYQPGKLDFIPQVAGKKKPSAQGTASSIPGGTTVNIAQPQTGQRSRPDPLPGLPPAPSPVEQASTRFSHPVPLPGRLAIPDQPTPNQRPAMELAGSEAGRAEDQPVEHPPVTPSRPAPASRAVKDWQRALKPFADLPAQALFLGVCEDGLPVLLDFHDPSPGAIVVVGDEREEALNLLRTAVASLALRNSPRDAQFLVLSHQPETWKTWIAEQGFTRHCLSVESVADRVVRDWAIRLADWTEQRRLGQRSGPSVLVVFDTLNFLPKMDYDVRLNFEWMVKEGPAARIWSLAAVSSDLALTLGPRLLKPFQEHIFGPVNNPLVTRRMGGLTEEEAAHFGRPRQFAVRVGENWLRFRLPLA